MNEKKKSPNDSQKAFLTLNITSVFICYEGKIRAFNLNRSEYYTL